MAYNQELYFDRERAQFPDVISNSLITAYKACPLQAFYSGIYRIRPKQINVHLNAGKAYANALDVFRQGYYSGERSFEEARQDAFLSLTHSYGEYEPPEKNMNKAWPRVISALFYYLRVYNPKNDILKPTTVNGKIASEFSFAEPLHPDLVHPVTGNPILYTGRFDSIMEMGSEYNLFGYDDKTTTSLGPTWAEQWQLRSQFMGYSWGAAQYGIPLQGTIIRGISILKTKHEHAQAIVYHSKWMIDRWLQSTIHTVQSMIRDWENGYWDSSLDMACTTYGGCQFNRLCESPNPEDWIEPYFELNRWNPLTGEDDPDEATKAEV